METYKIKIEPSRLLDSLGKPVVVIISEGNSRHGERLNSRQYHVTVVDEEGRHQPGRTLFVRKNEEGGCFCELDHSEGGSRHLSETDLLELRFIFVPLQEVI